MLIKNIINYVEKKKEMLIELSKNPISAILYQSLQLTIRNNGDVDKTIKILKDFVNKHKHSETDNQ